MSFTIEDIKPEHDDEICHIIITVGEEFGAIGDGFGSSDTEVLTMSDYYKEENYSRYFVAKIADNIVGGGGIAPFNNSVEICELKKLFLLPDGRGFGIGRDIAERCLTDARSKGFKQCYLDTLTTMKTAITLYEKMGFSYLDKPLEGAIHNGCNIWMIKNIK